MATLQEQLNQLSDEELAALKQQFLNKGRNRSTVLSGLTGMAEGAMLGLQGRPVSELSALRNVRTPSSGASGTDLESFAAKERLKKQIAGEFKQPEDLEAKRQAELDQFTEKERIKRKVAGEFVEEPSEFEQGRLDMQQQREERIAKEQDMRQKRFQIEKLFSVGGEVDQDTITQAEEVLFQDLSSELEQGRGIPKIDKDTGERSYRILSDAEWRKKIEQGKFSSTEIEHLQTVRAEHRAWTNVLQRLQELGINPESAGDVEFDMINSPIGSLSIPARFNLAGQFAKDPRYSGIKRDIELAFQQFRKRVTGAQASDRELKMLRPLIASLKDRPQVFFTTIQQSIENAEIAYNDRIDLYNRAGRDTTQFEGLFPTVSPGVRMESPTSGTVQPPGGSVNINQPQQRQPTPDEALRAKQRGAVGYDTEQGVFVDAQGNPI